MRLGLIIIESMTNSVKHAFHEVAHPKINISTSINAASKLILNYADNGPGMNTMISDPMIQISLGLKLIELLKKQLGDRYVVMA